MLLPRLEPDISLIHHLFKAARSTQPDYRVMLENLLTNLLQSEKYIKKMLLSLGDGSYKHEIKRQLMKVPAQTILRMIIDFQKNNFKKESILDENNLYIELAILAREVLPSRRYSNSF